MLLSLVPGRGLWTILVVDVVMRGVLRHRTKDHTRPQVEHGVGAGAFCRPYLQTLCHSSLTEAYSLPEVKVFDSRGADLPFFICLWGCW